MKTFETLERKDGGVVLYTLEELTVAMGFVIGNSMKLKVFLDREALLAGLILRATQAGCIVSNEIGESFVTINPPKEDGEDTVEELGKTFEKEPTEEEMKEAMGFLCDHPAMEKNLELPEEFVVVRRTDREDALKRLENKDIRLDGLPVVETVQESRLIGEIIKFRYKGVAGWEGKVLDKIQTGLMSGTNEYIPVTAYLVNVNGVVFQVKPIDIEKVLNEETRKDDELKQKEGWKNRKVESLPTKKVTVIEIIMNKSGEEHFYLCEWFPFDKSEYTEQAMPSKGYLGTARVIEGEHKGIGFNAWKENNSEFIYYKLQDKN